MGSIAATELELYATHSSHRLYKQAMAIARNLAVKKKRGDYKSELGKKAFMQLANQAAKEYAKEHGERGAKWHDMFNTEDRKDFADTYEKWFRAEYKIGNFESILPAKYQAAATKKATREGMAHAAKKRDALSLKSAAKKEWSSRPGDAGRSFKPGDAVMITTEGLQAHSRSIPASSGYSQTTINWRRELSARKGKRAIVQRVFKGGGTDLEYPDGYYVQVFDYMLEKATGR